MGKTTPATSSAVLTKAQVDEFELIESQLARFRDEIALLAKSKASDALNAFKLSLLNGLLVRANALLGTKYSAVPGFSTFNPDDLPSNSDAVLVVSQYLAALEKLRSDFIVHEHGYWYWLIDGKSGSVRTTPPAKLAR